MKTIIITGISGFIGTNVSKIFEKENISFIGVSRRPSKNQISYEDLDSNLINEAEAIVHLAGIAHDINGKIKEEDYFKINTDLTKSIFNKFTDSNCKTFIYLSSIKAITDNPSGIVRENLYPEPTTVYGKSKLKAEMYIRNTTTDAKRIFILRPCMVHGPNNKGNLNLLFNLVSLNIPWVLGSYSNQRSFCSIDNLINIIVEIIHRKEIESGTYNIADDGAISTNELVELIGLSMSKKIRIWKVPKVFINVLVWIGDRLGLPFNSNNLSKLTESYIVSNEKIKRQIKKDLTISLREGLSITFKSFNKSLK